MKIDEIDILKLWHLHDGVILKLFIYIASLYNNSNNICYDNSNCTWQLP